MAVSPPTTLADALRFTPADLDANRAGHLSAAQIERLKRGWRRALWISIGIVIAVGFAATVLLFLAQQNNSSILTLLGILLTLVNAITVGLGAQNYLRMRRDLDSGRVDELSGVISHTIRVTGRAATYVLKIGGQEVVVAKPVFFAFEDNHAYRLYRAASSKTLLTAEPL